jgi:hypothetical protein
MNRFKMSFNNYGATQQSNIMLNANASSQPKVVSSKTVDLNTPMIGRVYKAKPGCSACGKKVS